MDVFGPIADNANGIGEMGYEKEEMGEAKYAEARQILADLDAVGNTTKAVTKGVAIGSAVIASVSLFASFITVIGSGGGGENAALPTDLFSKVAGLLSISHPKLLVGMIIGGCIPMLFSSMTIRAVGRAAFLIVNECRAQFRRPGVMEGTTLPDYGQVVGICTTSAQHELIGPALLAVFAPILTGFVLGPIGLAGFLGGSIIVGQLLASFMCNAGGAWDNAKKMVEDEPRNAELNTGKGSEKHKAAVTGDTVGDPLKDTAGPAINPLLKVMNMVSVLTVPLMVVYDRQIVDSVKRFAVESGYALRAGFQYKSTDLFWVAAVLVSAGVLVWSIRRSHQPSALEKMEQGLESSAQAYQPGD
jgi:K(+)-stimulated pyrophosphate-energized sodium pump